MGLWAEGSAQVPVDIMIHDDTVDGSVDDSVDGTVDMMTLMPSVMAMLRSLLI